MHFRLFDVCGIPVYGLGACLLVSGFAFLTAMALLLRRRRENLAPAIDLTVLMWVGYTLLARVLYAVNAREWTFFTEFEVSKFQDGAWGGQIGFALFVALYLPFSRVPVRSLTDALAVSWAMATIWHKIGCFLAGCCHGAETSVPWAVVFPQDGLCALAGRPIHPTQLYDAGAALLISAGLLAAYLRRRGEGRLLWWWGLLYAVTKFASEWTRGDGGTRFPMLGPLTTAMAVEIVAAIACVAVLMRPVLWRRFVEWQEKRAEVATGPNQFISRRMAFSITLVNVGLAITAAIGTYLVAPAWSPVAFVGYYVLGGLVTNPALRFFGLRLVDGRGGEPGVMRLVVRGLASALGAALVLWLFRPLFDRRGRSLGDACAGTVLVRRTVDRASVAC
ncbi:MAG: prolipoprotein diacylglyceryl transferase [Planctomycetes bacterium]|nr:prolipoprotein diacylglyceryl transferase [Planctomycetota bacterium]